MKQSESDESRLRDERQILNDFEEFLDEEEITRHAFITLMSLEHLNEIKALWGRLTPSERIWHIERWLQSAECQEYRQLVKGLNSFLKGRRATNPATQFSAKEISSE